MRYLVSIVFCIFVFSACQDAADDTSVECPPDSFLTWETFGDSFFRNWCTSCHSSDLATGFRQDAPREINFDSHTEAMLYNDRTLIRAGEALGGMPPLGGPTEAERAMLVEWIQCGAP